MTSDDSDESRDSAKWRELNRANWDERVPIHVASPFYGVEEFRSGAEALHTFELGELGDVAGKDVVHLQCHFGKDTLSLARKGATVTGLDFSLPAIEAARALATEIGVTTADFVHSDVYSAQEALERSFDIVYTGKGAINWLPDLEAWAAVKAGLLRPGGFLYLSEFHPFMWMFADDEARVCHPYFNEGAEVWDDGADYADSEARLENSVTVEWPHPLSEVISSISRVWIVCEQTSRRAPWTCGAHRRREPCPRPPSRPRCARRPRRRTRRRHRSRPRRRRRWRVGRRAPPRRGKTGHRHRWLRLSRADSVRRRACGPESSTSSASPASLAAS